MRAMPSLKVLPAPVSQRSHLYTGKPPADPSSLYEWVTVTNVVFAVIATFWGSFIWWVDSDTAGLHYHHAIIGATIYLLARFLIKALAVPKSVPRRVNLLNRNYFPKSLGVDIALLCTPLYLYMIYLSRRPGWGGNYDTYTTIGQFINWMTLLSFVFSMTAVANLPAASPYFDFGTLSVWVWTTAGATVFTYLGSIKVLDFAITPGTTIPGEAKAIFIAVIVVVGLLITWWAFGIYQGSDGSGVQWWLEGLGCVGLGVVINGLATYGSGDLKLVETSSGNSIGADTCGIAAIVVFALILAPSALQSSTQLCSARTRA